MWLRRHVQSETLKEDNMVTTVKQPAILKILHGYHVCLYKRVCDVSTIPHYLCRHLKLPKGL